LTAIRDAIIPKAGIPKKNNKKNLISFLSPCHSNNFLVFIIFILKLKNMGDGD